MPAPHPDADAPPSMRERALIMLLRLLRWTLRAVTWPARVIRKLRRLPIRVTPFRGYGSGDRIIVRGRLVDTPPIDPGDGGRRRRLRKMLRRLSTPPVPAARIEGAACGERATCESGTDGMFTLRFEGLDVPPRRRWQPVEVTADAGRGRRATARAEALIPSPDARFAVISDIDDTVVFTGVANRLAMMWRLFATEAESRVAFEGVGELYRALHGGESGGDNPIFYVSRGPWSIYPVLEEFFRQRTIPVGPVLLLRDWGVSLGHPWPKRASRHKDDLIDELLGLYPDLPFVLIGDSGQHDPEIYAAAVERWGERIACSYIRDVSDDPERTEAIERLARSVRRRGSEMVLAADTASMARHAARAGFITPEDVARIERQAKQDRRQAAGALGRDVPSAGRARDVEAHEPS